MLDLSGMFNWGYLDVDFLEDCMRIAEKFGIYSDDVRNDISNYCGDVTDINSWIYSTMSLTFYAIMDRLVKYIEYYIDDEDKKEYLLSEVDELRDNLDIYVNCLDSFYNNVLDDVDLSKDVDDICEDIINILLENYE